MRKIAFLAGGYGPLSPEAERRHKILMSAATSGTQIDMYGGKGSIESRVGKYVPPTDGKRTSIESIYDEYLAVPHELKIAIEAEQEGYDAIILSCGNDPGIDALREAVSIPVIGQGNSSMHICSLTSHRFSRLLTHRVGRQRLHRLCYENYNGLMKWVSSRDIGMTVLEVRDNPVKTIEAAVKHGKLAINEDGADALTWSCGSMSFTPGLAQRLMEELKVPVVNPIEAAVRMAEYAVDFKIKHSKLGYPTPKQFIE